MVDLGTLGANYAYAYAVNKHGQVVGVSARADGLQKAFSWTAAGGMIDLDPFDDNFSGAGAVNASGQVVGYKASFPPYGPAHATLWQTR